MKKWNNTPPNYQYADVLKNPNPFSNIEDLTKKQVEMTNTVINTVTLLVFKMCK